MKVAAPYTNDGRWKDIPDEYNINYTETSTLQKLTDFCELYPNKRINILFKDVDIDFDVLKIINKLHKNIAVRLVIEQLSFIKKLQEENIKFFFDKSLPCYSFGLLDFMLKLNVSDIYIYDALCYQMPIVKDKCNKQNIQIRLVLNKIPTNQPNAGQDYRAPIFTPRDMDTLENFIDVAEFDCFSDKNIYDWHKFNVYYKAWIIKHDWLGFLSDIMPEVQLEIPIYSLPPNSNKRKTTCGRRCSLNSSCTHCLQWIEIAQELWNNNVYIKNKGKKEELTEE